MLFILKTTAAAILALAFSAGIYRLIKYNIIRKRLLVMLREVAEIRNLKIDEYQLLHEQILGMDRRNGILIYLNYAHRINSRIIDLKEVTECTLILKQVVAQLELTYRQPSRPPVSVCFYRKYSDPAFKRKSRVRKAVYWKELITGSPFFGGETVVARELDEQAG